MDKKTGIVIGIVVAVFAVLVGVSMAQRADQPVDYADYKLKVISEMAEEKSYDGYDLTEVIPADENSGNIAEHIKGDPEAPVKIYEYADYQCEHCAALNPYLNKIVEDYEGKVAVVYRNYIMPYHANGVISASAANAAGLQGYWAEYKDLLFSNQNEWFSMKQPNLTTTLEGYFVKASNGKGDLEKFREDMKSEAVAQKVAFDLGLGDAMDIQWTPYVYVEDVFVSQKKDDETSYSHKELDEMIRAEIDRKLAGK